MNKSYIWKQKDTITAARLNTMSCAVNCLIDALPAQLSCKSRAQNQTINQGDMQEQIPPQKYRHDTSLYWRHPHLGQADIVGNETKGYYATPPAVVLADGTPKFQATGNGCIIPSCKLSPMPCAEKSTLYIEINTDNTGQLVGTPYYTWDEGDTRLYGLKRGTGKLQYPVARVIDNPKYPCEKVPLNSHAPALPIIPDDGSYTPPHVTGQRHIMGASWIDGLSGAVIPVRGMNIHGGGKWLGTDTSGICKSNAYETSIEMYGLVPTGSKYASCGFPYCVPCELVGTGRGQFSKHCQRFYAPVNTCQPYKVSGDGRLAAWPIYQRNEKIGELVLNGLHLCDWQLVYQGTGEIHLPCSLCYGVIPSTARDNKYNIRTYSASGKNYLEIKEQERISCFGLCGNQFFNRAGAWCEKSCLLVEIGGGGAPVGSHGVEIHTLPAGSAPAGCVSRWCDNILHLVQSPVMSCNCVTGYKLI